MVQNHQSQSQRHSYFTTGGLPPISSSWRQAPWGPRPEIFFQLNSCGHSSYATPSLTKGCVCRLPLLLVLVSAVILGPESRGTHDHTLLSQIRDSPNLEGQNDQSQESELLYDWWFTADQFLLVTIPFRLMTSMFFSQTERLRLYSLRNILSDERMGLPFTIAVGYRQHSHSRVQVPRDSWPYFTVSDSRLLQTEGPGPRIYMPPGIGCPRYYPRHWISLSSPPMAPLYP
jgi:hypothetical protein